jgi:hypothetical protein
VGSSPGLRSRLKANASILGGPPGLDLLEAIAAQIGVARSDQLSKMFFCRCRSAAAVFGPPAVSRAGRLTADGRTPKWPTAGLPGAERPVSAAQRDAPPATQPSEFMSLPPRWRAPRSRTALAAASCALVDVADPGRRASLVLGLRWLVWLAAALSDSMIGLAEEAGGGPTPQGPRRPSFRHGAWRAGHFMESGSELLRCAVLRKLQEFRWRRRVGRPLRGPGQDRKFETSPHCGHRASGCSVIVGTPRCREFDRPVEHAP